MIDTTAVAYPIVGVGSKFVHRHQRLAGPSRGVRDGLPSAAHFGLRVAPFDGNVDRVAHVQPAQARRIPFPLQRHRSVANRPGNWNRRRDPPYPSCQDKIVVLLVNRLVNVLLVNFQLQPTVWQLALNSQPNFSLLHLHVDYYLFP